jgi:hypothetical protein
MDVIGIIGRDKGTFEIAVNNKGVTFSLFEVFEFQNGFISGELNSLSLTGSTNFEMVLEDHL